MVQSRSSNAENIDKAMLSLASAGLGFSLLFVKDLLAYAPTGYLWLLYTSLAPHQPRPARDVA